MRVKELSVKQSESHEGIEKPSDARGEERGAPPWMRQRSKKTRGLTSGCYPVTIHECP